jgi:DNA-binding transcriptional LysR family regulator
MSKVGSSVSLAALAAEPWVAAHDAVCRDAFVQACRTAGFQPRVVSTTNDYAAMQGLVAGGVGVALIPRLAAGLYNRPGVVLRPLAEPLIERVTFIVSRAGAYRSRAAQAIASLLHEEVRGATPSGLPLEALEVEPSTPLPRRTGRTRRSVTSSP